VPNRSAPPVPLSRRDATHERIVEAASRALRHEGFAGVGVADVMRRAGLTHGGFYAHFDSREALLAEAIARAGRDSGAVIERRIEAARARGLSPLRALVDGYLSDAHLGATESGCVVAALSSELARQSAPLRAPGAKRVDNLIALVLRALPDGTPEEQGVMIAGTLVGSLQLARTLGVNARGKALLAAARSALLAQYDTP